MKAIVLVWAFAACSSPSAEPPPPATPAVAPATAAPAAPVAAPAVPAAGAPTGEPRAVILESMRQALARKTRVRSQMTMANAPPNAPAMTAVTLSIPPDTRQVTMSMMGREMDLLIAGNRSFRRNAPTAEWVPMPTGAPAQQSQDMTREILTGLESGQGEITRDGEEVRDGRPMTIYRMSYPFAGGTVNSRAWVGADGLVYHSESETQSGSHMVMDYEYDDTITIEVPPA